MAEVALAAQSRPAKGSANTRRLRKEGRIPAVLYGHGTDPVSLSVDAKALRQALTTDHGMNALLSLDVDGKKQLAFTRDVQWHPVRRTVSHVDFLVVRKGESLTAEVPINVVGEAEQVTKMGGIVEQQLTAIEVTAPATDFPGHIELDITDLELEGALRVSDLVLPKGVTTEVDPGEAIVLGRTPKISAEDEALIEGAPTAEDGESPVVEGEEGASEGEGEGEESKSSDNES